ncbi:MAG TPA: DUF4249 domain-containing protein [Flavisolibacter sp.]|nr:DUF4249 domain-containing protein [Flavisolibacter sp.]
MSSRLILGGLCSILLLGCEKSIDFELKEESPKLVVEATIENDEPPIVTLTRSVGFFSNLTPEILTQSFVRNAEVYVSNGTLTHRLKEYTVPILPGVNLYYYSIDSTNLATAFEGEINKQYNLRVLVDGQEYTATTTIPEFGKSIDSMYWKPAPATSDTNKGVVMVRVTDQPGYGDYVRVFTRTNQGRFLPPYNSVFDDLFIDGTTYEVQLEGGIDRNADTLDDDFFFRGDTVDLKLSTIDKQTFDFWRTWEFSYSSVGNPFSTPVKVLGNISNNALGYFGGYASQYKRLIIPQ